MEVSKRRSVVAAGSVWESRMKSDEVRGGIKVFKDQQNPAEATTNVNNVAVAPSRLRRNSIGKRKTWKSETHKNSEEILSISSDGIKKSPIQTRRTISGDKFERKLRSDTQQKGESGEGQFRKTKSYPIKKENNDSSGSATDSISIQLRKTESEVDHADDEPRNEVDDGCEKIECDEKDDAADADDDDENCKDFDVCQEKEISENVGVVQSSHELCGDSGDEEEDVVDEEIEIEKESFYVKEISIPESKVVVEQDKEVVISKPEPEQEPKKVVNVNEPEPKKVVVSANMRFHHRNERRPVSVPLAVKQSPAIRRNSAAYHNFSQANSIPKAKEEHCSFPQTQTNLQSLVDLIMWRDVSRSAFVFGIGTFIIISSSYAKDINLSLISAVSYVGLVYLAVIFLYRSLICRGVIDVVDSNYVLGEEEAIWMLKLILPYLNEFLSKLKALFSGDPGTTMKLAVLLFVLARCGSFITIWKMAKFGFFGVFTVPKICCSYSAQLTAYANFWIRRFRDAWDSCTHKKAVALGIFGLVWNLSSVVARIWAVFVLFVAFRYYQQHYLVKDEWVEDEEGCDETWQEPVSVGVRQNQESTANIAATNKVKKGF